MSSIFHGGNTYIFYNTDASNNIPTAIGYENIDYLGAFPQVKINSSTTQLETYNDEWVQVLSGSMSIDSVSIVVHYVADNSSHVFLDNAFTNQTNFQIKVSLYESQDSLEQHYVILSGYISAWSDSADQNEVYDRTYTFTAEDIISRGAATDPAPLKQGDFGLGADGETIPQYESSTPSGNSFIKVPALRGDNPLGIDMGGFAYVDNGGEQTAQFIISETGPLNLYIKNTDNNWTQLKTTSQNDQTYVPLTRTVNGKALSGNITLSKSDVGLSAVTNDAQLKISSNLSDLADVATSRTNLSVYSKAEVDSTVSTINTTIGTLVPKTTTVNGHALSNNVTVTAADVGLGAVLNAVQLVASNNLSDVANVTTARTNISAAKSGSNSDITSITGLTTALSIAQGGTGNATGNAPTATLAASATKLATARTITTNLASTTAGSFDGTGNITPGVSGVLQTANGGTGQTTLSGIRSAISLAPTDTPTFAGMTLTGPLTSGSTANFSGTLAASAGNFSVSVNIGNSTPNNYLNLNPGYIELYNTNPFLDFHYANSTADYTARIIHDSSSTLSVVYPSGSPGRFRVTNGAYACKQGVTGSFNNNGFNYYWNTSSQLEVWVDTTQVGNMTMSAASDQQLKKDIVYLESTALDEVKQWKPVIFKYKARGIIPESDTQYGFIANDLVTVSPDVVKGKGLPDDYDIEEDPNNPDAYSLDQIAMISKLTQAIQQQQVLIEALQTQVNALANN